MKLDKEDSLLAMRILLIKNKKKDVLDEEQFNVTCVHEIIMTNLKRNNPITKL